MYSAINFLRLKKSKGQVNFFESLQTIKLKETIQEQSVKPYMEQSVKFSAWDFTKPHAKFLY